MFPHVSFLLTAQAKEIEGSIYFPCATTMLLRYHGLYLIFTAAIRPSTFLQTLNSNYAIIIIIYLFIYLFSIPD
jgi:hypothetical protein